MKKQMLFLTGTILLSAAISASAVLASGTPNAVEGTKAIATKVMVSSEPIDYKLKAREFIVKKYGEPFEIVEIVNECKMSLPYSKVELWDYKIYTGDKSYSIQVNMADDSITENIQPYLDAEEKAVKKVCGKLNQYLYEQALNLKDDETVDAEIRFNMSYSPEITLMQENIAQKEKEIYQEVLKKYPEMKLNEEGRPIDKKSIELYYSFSEELFQAYTDLREKRERLSELRNEEIIKFKQPLMKQLSNIGVAPKNEPEGSLSFIAAVTKKQLKEIEAIEAFYKIDPYHENIAF